jgi:hypothetical protein
MRRAIVFATVVAGMLAAVPPAWAGTIASTPKSTWETNGRVLSILHLSGVTYVAGTFTQVMNHTGDVLTRSNLAAFDASGNATTWAPSANGTVYALVTDGTRIYAGGAFTQINGKGHHGIAAVGTDGSVPTWSGKATGGSVQALAQSGATLYLGGTFTSLDGSARTNLGAVNSADGSLQSWAPTADDRVDAMAADSAHVFVGGFFTHINGGSQNHIAALSPTTGNPLSWTTHTSAPVLNLDEVASTLYAGIGGTGGQVMAWNLTGKSLWTAQTDGNVEAVTVANGEVIAGGHYQNFCDAGTNCQNPIVRHHIAALNASTGVLDTTWHPNVNSSLGVYSLAATATDLYLGGDFTAVGGIDQEHFADLAITP